jgi:hypothetical protein
MHTYNNNNIIYIDTTVVHSDTHGQSLVFGFGELECAPIVIVFRRRLRKKWAQAWVSSTHTHTHTHYTRIYIHIIRSNSTIVTQDALS